MDVREQMAVMAGTELLAGFHGANLINLLFMPPVVNGWDCTSLRSLH
jgi:capsular polysaccharide biosynthesis protein